MCHSKESALVTDTVPFSCSFHPFVLGASSNHMYLLILTLPTSSYFNYLLVVIFQRTWFLSLLLFLSTSNLPHVSFEAYEIILNYPDSLVFAVLSPNFFKKLETSFTESDEDTGYRFCLDCRSHFEDLLDVKRHSLCLKIPCRVSTTFHSHSRYILAETWDLVVMNCLLVWFLTTWLFVLRSSQSQGFLKKLETSFTESDEDSGNRFAWLSVSFWRPIRLETALVVSKQYLAECPQIFIVIHGISLLKLETFLYNVYLL